MAQTLEDVLNRTNPNTLADALRAAKIGKLLGLLQNTVKGAVASHIMVLPEALKARSGLRAFVTAGTVTGEFSYVNGTPATTQFTVNKDGNFQFFATDAVTAAEVAYMPLEGDVIEEIVQVTTNVGTLLGGRSGILLLSATALTGTSLGAKTTVARAAAPGAGAAGLNLAGTGVAFNAGDAVTKALIRYVAFPTASLVSGLVASSDLQ